MKEVQVIFSSIRACSVEYDAFTGAEINEKTSLNNSTKPPFQFITSLNPFVSVRSLKSVRCVL